MEYSKTKYLYCLEPVRLFWLCTRAVVQVLVLSEVLARGNAFPPADWLVGVRLSWVGFSIAGWAQLDSGAFDESISHRGRRVC